MTPQALPVLDQPEAVACCAPLSAEVLGPDDAQTLSRQFAALADPVRLRLVSLLSTAADGAVCACDLVEPVGKSQPTVSHHLKVLAEAGLTTRVEDDTTCCYAVQDKVWVTGPGGEPWEVYTVTGDARPELEGEKALELSAVGGDANCCVPGDDGACVATCC